jgi:soluble cytochrome b562
MADQPCPCKQKLTEGEKGVLSAGLSQDMLKNPNAAAIGLARQLGGKNGDRIAGLINNPDALTAVPSLQRMKNSIDNQKNTVNAFEKECNRFTDPRSLTSIVSSLSLFGEMNCALGIEGIDIGVGLNVVNNNGQFSIDYMVNANIDLEKILNKFSDGSGTDLANKVKDLQSGLDDVFKKMDEADAALNKIMDESAAMQKQATDFIAKYTSITSLANMIDLGTNDPCFKLGKTVNGSLVSPEFLNAVNNAGFAGGGTSNR